MQCLATLYTLSSHPGKLVADNHSIFVYFTHTCNWGFCFAIMFGTATEYSFWENCFYANLFRWLSDTYIIVALFYDSLSILKILLFGTTSSYLKLYDAFLLSLFFPYFVVYFILGMTQSIKRSIFWIDSESDRAELIHNKYRHKKIDY